MSKSQCAHDCYLRVSHLILDCHLPFVSKLGAGVGVGGVGSALLRSSWLAGGPQEVG